MIEETQKLLTLATQNESGSVVVDSRGRNVWQWNDEQLDSTTIMLKKLENDALELEPTRRVPLPRKLDPNKPDPRKKARRLAKDSKPGTESVSLEEALDYDARGGGFDPYNRS